MINSANPIDSNSAAVTDMWNNAGGPEGNESFSGTITQNADGTYTLTFVKAGETYTATFIWNPGRGGGYWTLTNGTITNSQNQQIGTWGICTAAPLHDMDWSSSAMQVSIRFTDAAATRLRSVIRTRDLLGHPEARDEAALNCSALTELSHYQGARSPVKRRDSQWIHAISAI